MNHCETRFVHKAGPKEPVGRSPKWARSNLGPLLFKDYQGNVTMIAILLILWPIVMYKLEWYDIHDH